MKFIHEDSEFDDLLRIVAAAQNLDVSLVEKDYWVTHSLWALHQCGLELWFKGGTSLSKGFKLIERFSEDLDLKVDSGRVVLPPVSNWHSGGATATSERSAYFAAAGRALAVPGAQIVPDPEPSPDQREARFRVMYPGKHVSRLPGSMRAFVLLEIGRARVTPYVERDMTSFVHDYLRDEGKLGDYVDNRPVRVRCVHPLVTLLEKLDAIQRRYGRADVNPAVFVRHYEDAAKIIRQAKSLPPLPEEKYPSVLGLASEMDEEHELARMPASDNPGFLVTDERALEVKRAYDAIAPMFWGARIRLEEATDLIRAWIKHELEIND